MKKTLQKGFSAIEALLILVIVALVAGVGVYVWKQSKSTNPSSQAETSAAVPVYQISVTYKDHKFAYNDYAVGNTEKARKLAVYNALAPRNKPFAKDKGIAFYGYNKKSGLGVPVYSLSARGGGERINETYRGAVKYSKNQKGVATLVFSTSKRTARVLEKGYKFTDNGTAFRAYDNNRAGNVAVYRLWKKATKDNRRVYEYVDSSKESKELEKRGYTSDGVAFYGPKDTKSIKPVYTCGDLKIVKKDKKGKKEYLASTLITTKNGPKFKSARFAFIEDDISTATSRSKVKYVTDTTLSNDKNEAEATHEYKKAGTYQVSVTVQFTLNGNVISPSTVCQGQVVVE